MILTVGILILTEEETGTERLRNSPKATGREPDGARFTLGCLTSEPGSGGMSGVPCS